VWHKATTTSKAPTSKKASFVVSVFVAGVRKSVRQEFDKCSPRKGVKGGAVGYVREAA
jgi:hypothetical protein